MLMDEVMEHLSKSHKQNPYLLIHRVAIFRISKAEMLFIEMSRNTSAFWKAIDLAFR